MRTLPTFETSITNMTALMSVRTIAMAVDTTGASTFVVPGCPPTAISSAMPSAKTNVARNMPIDHRMVAVLLQASGPPAPKSAVAPNCIARVMAVNTSR